MKNGVATALEVVLSESNLTASNASDSVSFVAGDTISVRTTPTGTPDAIGRHYWNALITTAGVITPIFGAGNASASNTAVNFISSMGSHNTAWSTTELDYQIVVPTAGTLHRLYVKLNGTPASSKSYDITLMKNGVATLLTVNIANAATTGNDVADDVSVIAGDVITIRSTPNNTPSARAVFWGMQFTPTVDGESFFGAGSAQVPSASTTNFEQILSAGSHLYNTSENVRYMVLGGTTLKKIDVKLGTAPSVGHSRAFMIRRNLADTLLEASIAGAATTGSDTDDVTIAQGDKLVFRSTITGTPAALTGGVHMGVLMYIAPTTSIVRDIIGGKGVVVALR